MTLEKIKDFVLNQTIEINDKYYRFHKNGKLEITENDTEVIWGEYKFRLKDNIIHLYTNPWIFEEKAEFPVEIVLDGKVSLILDN
jgi:hypothetical protein